MKIPPNPPFSKGGILGRYFSRGGDLVALTLRLAPMFIGVKASGGKGDC